MSDLPTGSSTSSPQVPSGGTPPPPPDRDPSGPGPTPAARSGPAAGWGVALIAAGGLWSASLAGVAIRWEVLLPALLVGVGVVLLVRPRTAQHGLVGVGVVLLVLTLLTAVLPGSASVSAGDRTHVVTEIAGLEAAYDLGAGTLVLDLAALELTEATEVAARVGMGELVVVVPDGVRLEGRARVGLGEVDVFGETIGGVAPASDLAGTGDVDGATLTLDLQVGMGQLEVRR